jgi:hypothetical protein
VIPSRLRRLALPAGLAVAVLAQTSAGSAASLPDVLTQRHDALTRTVMLGAVGGAASVIEGRVLLVKGNCQPTEPGMAGDCTATPLKLRKVFVYSPPLLAGGFRGTAYAGIRRPKLGVRTDTKGRYRIALPAGTYTVVAEDESRPYCNLFTRLACALRLKPSEHLHHDIRIDHSAV